MTNARESVVQGVEGAARPADWSSTDVHAWALSRTADSSVPVFSSAPEGKLPPLEPVLAGAADCWLRIPFRSSALKFSAIKLQDTKYTLHWYNTC
jgi:hypothetical protein